MDTIGERLKFLMKQQNLTQAKFADRLHLAQAHISGMCSGAKAVTDRTIMDICREFNVSEAWLRDGVGEMFVSRTPDQALAFSLGVLLESGTPFQKRFIRLLSELPPEDWDKVESFIKKLNRDE